MWLTGGHSCRVNRTRYLTYGIAYYLFAVTILMNLSHISRPLPSPTTVVHLLDAAVSKQFPKPIIIVRPPITQRVVEHKITNDVEGKFYMLRPNVVNAFPYDAVIRPDIVCPSDVFIVIIVHTHHPNFDKRKAIRETWGSVVYKPGEMAEPPIWPSDGQKLKRKARLLFLLGVHKDPGLNDQLWEESLVHKDIIQGNFFDSYRNMTLKSLLGLKILLEFCSKAEYLLKSDDDMFLNLPHFINTLEQKSLRRSILGPLSINARVYRNGKWKLTKEEFPFNSLPPYESGAAYVISSDLWKDLFFSSNYVPWIHIDDVYVTGILGKILNVTHVILPGFAFWNSKLTDTCEIKNNKIFSATKMTPIVLHKIWNELGNKELCKKITEINVAKKRKKS